MQGFKSKITRLATNTKVLFISIGRNLREYYRKNRELLGRILNIVTIAAFVIGLIALGALIWQFTRPLQLADIKVPVATDRAVYSPGEPISGIFFGETYYEGELRVLREVFCREYKAVITPPSESAFGDFFSTQAQPTVLEGQSVVIGNLPDDIPVGLNCIIRFTNVYPIQTAFGVRHEEYQYYTQNFSIVTRERSLQLQCEAEGRDDCDYLDAPDGATNGASASAPPPVRQSSPEATPAPQPTPSQPQNPQAEQQPAPRFEEQCTVDIFGIKVNCRQVPVD